MLLRACPEIVVDLVRDALGVVLPDPDPDRVRVDDADFTQLIPTEFHADLVVRVDRPDGAAALGVVVELQRAPDPDKRFSWPLYVAALHARLRCPICLLVLTDDDAVARWARRPITSVQLGSPFVPVVLGPAELPRLTDPDVARANPGLAVLGLIAHRRDPDVLDLALAAVDAAVALPDARGTLLYDLVLLAMPDEQRRALEDMMSARDYPYHSAFARHNYDRGYEEGVEEGRQEGREEGVEEGREEGRIEALRSTLANLIKRKVGRLPHDVAHRIDACDDPDVLSRWLLDVGSLADPADILARLD